MQSTLLGKNSPGPRALTGCRMVEVMGWPVQEEELLCLPHLGNWAVRDVQVKGPTGVRQTPGQPGGRGGQELLVPVEKAVGADDLGRRCVWGCVKWRQRPPQ